METASIGRARELARKLLKDSGCKGTPVMLKDIISYLKNESGLECAPLELSDATSGFLVEDEDVSGIAYNSGHHVHRQRFSVAHEIGHFMLSHNNQRKNDIDRDETNSAHEKEANAFATELLMPLEFLKKDLKMPIDIDELAKKYWVSKDAMSWRIQDPTVLKYVK
ncbi:ImmA/IrrE family metallo-endopeptidase [Patescibacteria group bacterium]|nr:ImmA/IrrE family metallo-endopeptidase [Patescibacteria group bacterium]